MVAFIGMVATRHAGQPDLARRRRLRHRRRLDRHHDGEHLPPPRPARQRHRCRSASWRRRARSAPPMLFSTLIIGVAFIPLFTLTGVAGVIFSPMAHTYAFAIGGAILLALTLTPVLAVARPAPRDRRHEKENWLMRALNRFYVPLFDFALAQAAAGGAASALSPVGRHLRWLSALLGGEFMPKLEEGNFWIRATLPTSISLEQSAKYVGRMRAILRGCPTKRGRDRATDAAPRAPRDRHGRLAARPPRRRHRRLRLLQHRAVRAAQARSSEWRARRDQGEADRRALEASSPRRSPASSSTSRR